MLFIQLRHIGTYFWAVIKTSCMRTIIAPTNFSDASLNAVNYAADMAVNTDASLVLLHVIPIRDSFDIPVIPFDYDGMLKSAGDQLNELKKQLQLRTRDEIEITTKAVSSSMAIELQELYRETHPFVIVIGPERENAVERFLFGSHDVGGNRLRICATVTTRHELDRVRRFGRHRPKTKFLI